MSPGLSCELAPGSPQSTHPQNGGALGIPGAAPTSWVSCWDRSLLLPAASRSTSVTDAAARGATGVSTSPCPGPDPPGACWWCLLSSHPPQPLWGHLDVSPSPPSPPQPCWALAGRAPRVAPPQTQLEFAGRATPPSLALPAPTSVRHIPTARPQGRVTVRGHHRSRGEDGARGHGPATGTAPGPSSTTGRGTRGQQIPGQPDPRGVPVPVPAYLRPPLRSPCPRRSVPIRWGRIPAAAP